MNTLSLATILAQEEGGGSILGLLIILIPMGAIFYLAIVPQRKARQRQAELLRSLDVGDEVVTNGGIIGVITHIEDDLYHLEVDSDVVVRIAKSAVASSTAAPDPKDAPPSRSRGGIFGRSDSDTDSDADDTDGKR